jgi:putative ABC transport system permease protein
MSDDHLDHDSTRDLPPEVIRPPVEKRVADELAFHIEMRARELTARGVPAEQARRLAAERFGDLDEVMAVLNRLERSTDRTTRRARYLAEVAHDWRFALRMITRRRTFAAVAIVTLGLGIGAATAIYSVFDSVLLRPLPFEDPGRIAAVWITQPGLSDDPMLSWLASATPMGHLEYDALRANAKTLRDVAMWTSRSVMLETDGATERLPSVRVTSSLLPALRARPMLGRGFVPGEDALGGPHVAMLSWETWANHFGADSTIIGRTIALDGTPHTIIGVLPAGLRLDRAADAPAFWLPALQDSFDIAQHRNRSYTALARLAPGATFAAASQEAAAIVRSATSDTALSARVEQWQTDQGRDARGPLVLLAGAVGLLLLIACANVAVLQLGEAAGRAREMTTRAALGAGTGRLVRQLLVESIAIAFASAVLGTAIAWAMMRGLIAAAPARLPGIDAVAIDARVLAFTVACATLTGLLFGIVPALVGGRQGTASLVRIGAGQSGRGTRGLQHVLIASQLALSTVLLVEAALLGRSLRALSTVDPGFRPVGLTAVSVALPSDIEDERARTLTNEVVRRLATVPGVERASASTQVPFMDGASSSPLEIDRGGADGPAPRHTQQRYVVPGYFETLGIRLLAGRLFSAEDGVGAEPVAIVSAAEVKRDFGGRSPLGRRVKHQRVWRRVVGVVADTKYRGLAREDEPTVYVPLDQYPFGWPTFVVRGPSVATVEPVLKGLLHELEPGAAVVKTATLPILIEKSFAPERYRTMIVAVFGAMAALLAAVGLYGVSVRASSRRTREIGIRLALGGTAGRVIRLLLGDAMTGVALGLMIGLPAALLAGRLVRPYLFAVGPDDPVSIVAVGALLVAVTAVASFLPARSAGRANPAAVLRGE